MLIYFLGQSGKLLMFKVAIRVDSSSVIGMGHLQRCLVLASELYSFGAEVVFLSRALPGNQIIFIQDKNFKCFVLPYQENSKYQHSSKINENNKLAWLGSSIEEDVQICSDFLDKKDCDLLIVDHYSLDKQWHKLMRPYCKKIMALDDLANKEFDCDILMNYNYSGLTVESYEKLVPTTCKLFLGTKYCLFKPELTQVLVRRKLERRFNQINQFGNILLFMGGADRNNNTSKILKQILRVPTIKKAAVHVVLGKSNPFRVQLKHDFAAYDQVIFYVQPDEYYNLLAQADLAIGAGGVSQLERLYLGLPSVAIPIAENQKTIYLEMLEANLLYSLEQFFKGAFLSLDTVECKIFDVRNILHPAEYKRFTIRYATIDDMDLLYEWQSDPLTRRYSFNQEPIEYEQHVAWFKASLQPASRCLFLLCDDYIPTCMIRFDLEKECAVASIYVDPKKYNRGYGNVGLRLAIQQLITDCPQVKRIIAEVLSDNQASHKLFQKLNFKLTQSTYELLI